MHSNICWTHDDALPHDHACNVCNNLIPKCGGGWLIHPDEIIQLLCEWMWCLLVSQTVYKHIMNFTCRLLQTYTNSASWNGGRLRVNEHTLLKFEVGDKLSGHWLFLQKPLLTDTLQFPRNLFSITHDICLSCVSLARTSLLAYAFSNGTTTSVTLTAKCQRWAVLHEAHIMTLYVVHGFNDACEHVCRTCVCCMCIVWSNHNKKFTHNIARFKQTCATSCDPQHRCTNQTIMFDYLRLFLFWLMNRNKREQFRFV